MWITNVRKLCIGKRKRKEKIKDKQWRAKLRYSNLNAVSCVALLKLKHMSTYLQVVRPFPSPFIALPSFLFLFSPKLLPFSLSLSPSLFFSLSFFLSFPLSQLDQMKQTNPALNSLSRSVFADWLAALRKFIGMYWLNLIIGFQFQLLGLCYFEVWQSFSLLIMIWISIFVIGSMLLFFWFVLIWVFNYSF